MKKFVAILLAAVMLFAIAVPAFAYEYLDLQDSELKCGRALKKLTVIFDCDELKYTYDYGNFVGKTKTGYEIEYLSKNIEEARISRELLDGELVKTNEYSYIYDENGNITGLNYYQYDANGDKKLCNYDVYKERDKDGNITKYSRYLDDYKGGFYKFSDAEIEYSNGKKISEKINAYYSSGDFNYRGVATYTYDANGNKVNYKYEYYYFEDSLTPTGSTEIEYEYDEYGNLSSYTNYSSGVKCYTGDYSYDSKGRTTYYHLKNYDEQGAVVNDKYHWEISYEDTEDGYVAIAEKVYHQAPGAKVEIEEEELSEETSIEAKNATAGVREKVNKDVVTLDKYGNKIKDVKFSWNGQTSDWDPYATETREYFEKPERSENPIIIDGKYDDETTDEVNPNTGAPVMNVALATVVCGAALVICKKHK